MFNERDENVATITVNLTSKITQDNETETFTKTAQGQLEEKNNVIRLSYMEDDTIPVKMLLKEDELIIKRGVDANNYSLMKFIPGEKVNCRYVVEGRQMDMVSVTNLLEYEDQGSSHQLRLEYDLFNGLLGK